MPIITLHPSKDKYSRMWPDYNDVNSPWRLVIKDGREPLPTGDCIPYIHFDLSAYAANDIINAVLRVWAVGFVDYGSIPITCNIKNVLEDWGENTGTWYTQPSVSAAMYQIYLGSADGWKEIPITDLAKLWATGPNYGLQITNISGPQTGRELYPRERSPHSELIITTRTPTVGDFAPESIIKIGPT